jgi:hypothetical protein
MEERTEQMTFQDALRFEAQQRKVLRDKCLHNFM